MELRCCATGLGIIGTFLAFGEFVDIGGVKDDARGEGMVVKDGCLLYCLTEFDAAVVVAISLLLFPFVYAPLLFDIMLEVGANEFIELLGKDDPIWGWMYPSPWLVIESRLGVLFIMASALSESGLMVPWSFWKSPHALQSVLPCGSRLQSGVLDVPQLEQQIDDADCPMFTGDDVGAEAGITGFLALICMLLGATIAVGMARGSRKMPLAASRCICAPSTTRGPVSGAYAPLASRTNRLSGSSGGSADFLPLKYRWRVSRLSMRSCSGRARRALEYSSQIDVCSISMNDDLHPISFFMTV